MPSSWKWAIANTLSLGNALCGVGISYASRSYYLKRYGVATEAESNTLFGLSCSMDVIVSMLLFSVLCDMLDGPSARRWGSTAWGGYFDASADAISYGVAPAVALYHALPGPHGTALAAIHFTCTVTRLCVFVVIERTAKKELRLDKLKLAAAAASGAPPPPPPPPPRPHGFSGLPSPLAASVVLCALALADPYIDIRPASGVTPATYTAAIALLVMGVGYADTMMVAFDIPFVRIGGIPRVLLVLGVLASLAIGGVATAAAGDGFRPRTTLAGYLFGLSGLYTLSPAADFLARLRQRVHLVDNGLKQYAKAAHSQ